MQEFFMSSAVAVPEPSSLNQPVLDLLESRRQVVVPARPDLYMPGLDGIRAVAFMMVFLAHAGLEDIVPGALGVTIFFFLSGYLITTLLRAEAQRTDTISIADFYLRRAFRIMPPFYITLAVAFAAGTIGLVPDAGNGLWYAATCAYFVNYAALLNLHIIQPSGLGMLWSLMVEEHFYLIFPCLYLMFVHRKASPKRQVAILLSCCAACLAWRYVLIYHFHTSTNSKVFPRWTYSASEARFDAIFFGCILAIRDNSNFADRSPWLSKYKGLFAIGGLLTLLASLIYREPHFRETLRYSVQSIALYPIFYYIVAAKEAWQARWLSWKPLRFLGWLSYTMYLSHYIFLEVFYTHYKGHPVVDATAAFAVSLLFSWLMRILVELPSKSWKAAAERRLFAKA
jgi:peptidoglycan/LPS O-acetylase OafA/YrhL